MPLLRTIHDDATRARLLARLDTLAHDAPGRWGRMSAHQMLCHLSDLFDFALGERPGRVHGGRFSHSVARWYALNVPLRWPHGFPTAREFDQERDGTPPDVFDADRDRVLERIHRFTDPGAELGAHPLFGPLSRAEWGRWGFRHTDHHLRQFGA